MPKRAFTPDEVYEIGKLVRRGFTGRAMPDDMKRCEELIRINSDEYSRLAAEVREQERAHLRSFGGK